MGMGAANIEARIAASVGELDSVTPVFQPALDVPHGGVLFALPALLAMGLLDTTEQFFELPKGYYGFDSLFMLLALMALARVKSIERFRYQAPGEWGKLLGLDRAPEVRTLRNKIRLLADAGKPKAWSASLSQRWMHAAPDSAGVLYIDGHVRVYNGGQTQLPRHYVARQKLCLRATTDYWVNAMDGQPFFVINQVVDPGLIKVIENDIVPRLDKEVPHQPDEEALKADPLLHRYTLVFDREGYSPEFFQRMKTLRIACITYHKFPGDDWSQEEFSPHTVKLPTGEVVEMLLAERGTRLRNNLWVREIRKLSDRGHQTAVLSTDYRTNFIPVAVAMFSRWSQENFFKYAKEHFNLDRLADYRTEAISDPIQVVNPAYRKLDGQVRSVVGKLNRLLAQFGAMSIETDIEPAGVERFMQKKADLHEQIEALQEQVNTLKETRKSTARHLDVKDLPEEDRFRQLSTNSKHFVDTIKIISYRAETVMANVLREQKTFSHPDEVRSLLRALYATEADLLPDYEQQTLTVRLHHMANRSADEAIQKLCDEINATETLFPRTELRMIFKLGTGENAGDQDL